MKQELDLLWRHVALYSGGKTFRAAIAKDLRGALRWGFSLPTLPEHQQRRARIVAWLGSGAPIPPAVVAYDASRGHTGASLDGAYPIAGDPPCCDLDPVYCCDQEAVLQQVRLHAERGADLKRRGFMADAPAVCAACRDRLGMEHNSTATL
jgi:hypothetical protein